MYLHDDALQPVTKRVERNVASVERQHLVVPVWPSRVQSIKAIAWRAFVACRRMHVYKVNLLQFKSSMSSFKHNEHNTTK